MSPYSVVVLVAHLALLGIGGWLIVIDARTHRLPNRIVLPTLAGALVLVGADALAVGDGTRLIRALLGALALGGFYAILHLASRQGMGGGDVKLAVVIGLVLAWHSWQTFLIGAAAAFVLGALYALSLMLLRKATRKTRIAFGPWMIVGAALAVLLS